MLSRAFRLFAILIAAGFIGAHAFAGADVSPGSTGNQSECAATAVVYSIPLDDGRLGLNDLVESISTCLGIELPPCASDLDCSLNVRAALGPRQIELLTRCTAGLLAIAVSDDVLRIALNDQAVDDHADRLIARLTSWLAEIAGTPDILSTHSFGISFITPDDSRAPVTALPELPARIVLLVPGLDDAGFIWRDLAPVLIESGYTVARFEYANDGPIAAAADKLTAELAALRAAGITHIDIVAHSMGGLVARDALTRCMPCGSPHPLPPGEGRTVALATVAGEGSSSADALSASAFPSIDRLILVGTPNHGSRMARLRFISECREQLVRLAARRGTWDGFSADGNGEAARDLLPGSSFLCELNARELPVPTRVTVIAGRWIDVPDSDAAVVVDGLINLLDSSESPRWLDRALHRSRDALVRGASSLLDDASDSLGDGVVTLKSAGLPGVDDVVVLHANHVSLLVGAADATPDNIAPAIPVILDRLAATPDLTN